MVVAVVAKPGTDAARAGPGPPARAPSRSLRGLLSLARFSGTSLKLNVTSSCTGCEVYVWVMRLESA
jgi:hypothetical protein